MSENLIALQNRFLGQGETVYDRLAQVKERGEALDEGRIAALAEEWKVPKALLRSVSEFYDELHPARQSDRKLRVCNGEPCQIAGSAACKSRLNAALRQSDVAVEDVTCLGYCGDGPNILFEDGHQKEVASIADASLEEKLVAALKTGESPNLEEPRNRVYGQDEEGALLLSAFGHVSLADAKAAGAYEALSKARAMPREDVVAEIEASQLRGRGGAGFPAGRKLRTVLEADSADGMKTVVVNADEGDAGAFIDKELLEQAPHLVLEGALIAARACGAEEVFIYLRAEYPRAMGIWEKALEECDADGVFGEVNVKLIAGHGAYVCGEETSLLRSLEGVPAQVSPKPPYPAIEGYKGRPTAVNNVETLASLPFIIRDSGTHYAKRGYARSRGTKLISISGAIVRPGLYEVEMGVSLSAIIHELAGGVPGGAKLKAVQVGGPLGGILRADQLDLPLDFEAFADADAMLGHGSIVVFDENVDLVAIGRSLMHFCAVESCGKCFPCRIGSVRGTELFDKLLEGRGKSADVELLEELNETMLVGSLCALGGGIPIPIGNLLSNFREEFDEKISDEKGAADA